ARAMQSDPDAVETRIDQPEKRLIPRIEGVRIDAATPQPCEHRVAAEKRDLTLARVAAEQHGDAAELSSRGGAALECGITLQAHQFGAPMIRTSVLSLTPCCRSTVSRTWPMSCSRSAEVARPWLMMKLACFSETEASPIR